jgi:hypothetical protein
MGSGGKITMGVTVGVKVGAGVYVALGAGVKVGFSVWDMGSEPSPSAWPPAQALRQIIEIVNKRISNDFFIYLIICPAGKKIQSQLC